YPRVAHTIGEALLDLTDVVAGKGDIHDFRGVSLTLHRGEILGLAGIVGAGRTELLRAIFGLDPIVRGDVVIPPFRRGASPRQRTEQGVGLLSEDRKGEGLALGRSIADNLTYSRLTRYSRWGWLDLGRRGRAVADWLGRLRVRAVSAEQPVNELSGGNQQKVA